MMTAIGSNLHLSPHTVCVPDNERGRDEFYPGTLVYSAHLDRDIGEIWADDYGFCWREVNDNIRPDRLVYGHASSLDDALATVVRQAERHEERKLDARGQPVTIPSTGSTAASNRR